MSTRPRQLDSRIDIVTPENIEFRYVLAGPFRRLPAYLVDCAICAGVLFVGLVISGFSTVTLVGPLGIGLWLVLAFILAWFYFGLFETFWNGQTPGKWLLGLRVLSVDGRPINAMQAIMRNLLRGVDALPMMSVAPGYGVPFYMVGLFSAACNARFQRLGDLACGTIVVVEQRSRMPDLTRVTHPEVLALAEALPVTLNGGRSMAQALAAYIARRQRFSPARRIEIAGLLAGPLVERLALPRTTNPDLLLCAMYYRTFIADRPQREALAASTPVAAQAVAP